MPLFVTSQLTRPVFPMFMHSPTTRWLFPAS